MELLDEGINVISAVNVQHRRIAQRRHRIHTRRHRSRDGPGLGRRVGRSGREPRHIGRGSPAAPARGEDLRARQSRRGAPRTSSPTRISRRCASSRCAKSRAPSIDRARRSCGGRPAKSVGRAADGRSYARRDVEQSRRIPRRCCARQPHRRPAQLRLVLRLRADARVSAPTGSTARCSELVDNIQLAQSMGAEVVKLEGDDVAATLLPVREKEGSDVAHRRTEQALAPSSPRARVRRRTAGQQHRWPRRARRLVRPGRSTGDRA